jgi:hypothetical protein
MTYNTERPKLSIREYGRYIQNLVRYATHIDDDEKRNAAAKMIIEIMAQTNPQFKYLEEYKHKLWDHLIMISDFKLVVDSPYPFPERKDVVEYSKTPLPYPRHSIKMRHYGRNLQTLVSRAKEFEGDKKKGLAEIAANYMKLCYSNWSHETISDEIVRQDLVTMSKGSLELDKDVTLIEHAPTPHPQFGGHRKNFKKKRKNFGNNRFRRRK